MLKEFIQEVGYPLAVTCSALVLFIGVVMAPIAYCQGKANAQILQQTKNITMPWYEAAFVTITITDNKIDVK